MDVLLCGGDWELYSMNATEINMSKDLLNPRGYLSHSQIEMWETNRAKYIEKYFKGNDAGIENDFMDFGKTVSTAIESGEKTGDEVTDMVIASIPRYKQIEHEIKVPYKTKHGYITLLGKLDTFEDKPTLRFREWKTGSKPWNASRAVSSKQMLMYDTLIWLKHQTMAKERHLDWFETERASDIIRFTGKVQHFQVNRKLQHVLSYLAYVSKIAKEIDSAYRKYIEQI